MDSSNLDYDSLSAQIKETLYSGADSRFDFNAAISLGEAILPASQEELERYKLLECLALCLCSRYETRNEWNDIERAIEYLQEVIEGTEENDSIRVAEIGQIYARCLRNRFMRGKSPDEIENAILFAEQSVSTSKTLYARDDCTKKMLVQRLGELSLCYFTKAHVLDGHPDAADAFDLAISSVNEARHLLGQEITNTGEGIEILSNLAMYSRVKFDQDPDQYLQSLIEAINIGRLVLQYEFHNPENKMQAYSNLALYKLRLARHYLDNIGDYSEDEGWKCLEEAISLMQRSLSIEEASPVNRMFNIFSVVLDIEKLSAERHQREALRQIDKLLRVAVDLLSQTVLTAAQTDQRDLLSTLYGLARYATAAALENGADTFEAMQLLEQGRTVILSNRMEPADELAFLKAQNSELAEKYSAIWKEMRAAGFVTKPLEARLGLLGELDAIKSRIQEEAGLHLFDQCWDKEAMIKLAEEGPIIAINITNIRSDALLILHNDICTLPLIALKEDRFSEKSWEIQYRLAQEGGEQAAEVAGDLHDLMLGALKELWQIVVKPILKRLGYTTVLEVPPRVWWIPTGILTLFPLHAAGNLTTNNNTMKYVISSYTPSLKLLQRSRKILAGINPHSTANQEAAEGAATGSALVLMMEETLNHDPLLKSHAEAAAVQKTFPNAKILSGPTREEALEYLQQCPQVVHFSCHGEVVYEDPLQSQILLAKAPLTVSDLQELQLQGAHLAFLSLCFAAHAGIERDQDEIIHIASAFQVAGFASVLATMWYVSEDMALQVVECFYEYFRKRGRFEMKEAAHALHEAVLQLRESTRNSFNDNKGAPIIWSSFVHFGV